MHHEYEGSWTVPASEYPRMIPNLQKFFRPQDSGETENREAYVSGSETAAMEMLYGIRGTFAHALGKEGGYVDPNHAIETAVAVAQYDFTRAALKEPGVASAEVKFAVTDAVRIPGETPDLDIMRFTTTTSLHRLMTTGELQLHMSADRTYDFRIVRTANEAPDPVDPEQTE